MLIITKLKKSMLIFTELFSFFNGCSSIGSPTVFLGPHPYWLVLECGLLLPLVEPPRAELVVQAVEVAVEVPEVVVEVPGAGQAESSRHAPGGLARWARCCSRCRWWRRARGSPWRGRSSPCRSRSPSSPSALSAWPSPSSPSSFFWLWTRTP